MLSYSSSLENNQASYGKLERTRLLTKTDKVVWASFFCGNVNLTDQLDTDALVFKFLCAGWGDFDLQQRGGDEMSITGSGMGMSHSKDIHCCNISQSTNTHSHTPMDTST